MMQIVKEVYGRTSRYRLEEAVGPGFDGALAALESFYAAFNSRSLQKLTSVWAADPMVQLNNPLGGVLRGVDSVRALYERLFTGNGRIWVEFHDAVAYHFGDAAIFAGRERGEFTTVDTTVPLSIRTSRVFTLDRQHQWRQVHHHGSIDDPTALKAYQQAVTDAVARG